MILTMVLSCSLLEAAEGQVKGKQDVIRSDIPQYIISKLGLNRDRITELRQELECDAAEVDKERLLNNEDKPSAKQLPSENDFELVKLISNGAYGAVYLVRHKETRQRFAMKKLNKANLVLRNQVNYNRLQPTRELTQVFCV